MFLPFFPYTLLSASVSSENIMSISLRKNGPADFAVFFTFSKSAFEMVTPHFSSPRKTCFKRVF